MRTWMLGSFSRRAESSLRRASTLFSKVVYEQTTDNTAAPTTSQCVSREERARCV